MTAKMETNTKPFNVLQNLVQEFNQYLMARSHVPTLSTCSALVYEISKMIRISVQECFHHLELASWFEC